MSEQATTSEPSFEEAMSKAYDDIMSPPAEQEEVTTPPVEETTPEEKPDEEVKPDEATEEDKKDEEPKAEVKTDVKAPTSWTPAMREKFATLEPEVQAEISRREKEVEQFVHRTSTERQVAQNFHHVVAPYIPHLQEMGVSPYEAIGSLLELGQKLTKGDAKAKAAVIGELFTNYGVDLDALNDELIERMKTPKPSSIEQQFLDKLNKIERQITTPAPKPAESTEALPDVTASIQEFAADPKNEFFRDVLPQMQKLLQAGLAEDLKDAYDQAIKLNPEVQKVLAKRDAEAKARVKNANVSLKSGTPKTAPKTTSGMDTRDVLSKAWDEMMTE